ncbi:MAG: glucuronate isomerase [Planctomycetaceae bacterium]|jgi:glucuronate isomerase|nr:glucuronate isomerase [Planctomycetaceae bacterium]
MSTFLTDNFLLQSEAAVRLYHEFAAALPIIDFHCHLPPKEIAEDRRFSNLTQIWLAGDHYKWRAMRAAGVSEEYITGNASDWEKFQAWAEVVPKTLRNPLYHWTHLELRRPFGITNRLLSPDTAKSIWNECNAKLQTPEFSTRGIMRQMNVKLVCTTDDPIDSLEYHQKIAADKTFDIQVLPTFRPDKAMQLADNTGNIINNEYVNRLESITGIEIRTLDDLTIALEKRHDFFHENGCRLSDHGFGLFTSPQSLLLYDVARWNRQKKWTMQLHIGAMRNNNTRFFEQMGPDSGFDSIIDGDIAVPLSRFFDELDKNQTLPKTIVYNLNPSWNDMLVTLLGNFQDGKTPGKMQFGSGWWFLDQKKGMEDQLNALSNHGLLSLFVGMVTDSRSFLSYTRHEYFRRILCNLLGEDLRAGLLPNDFDMIGSMVQDICYHNAERYFGF